MSETCAIQRCPRPVTVEVPARFGIVPVTIRYCERHARRFAPDAPRRPYNPTPSEHDRRVIRHGRHTA